MNLRMAMFAQFVSRIGKGRQMLSAGVCISSAFLLATNLGWFESLEISVADYFARIKSIDRQIDNRILVVTIGEEDITKTGQWPMSDAVMADLVQHISQHEPAAIGLDIYRNLPVEPGVEKLSKVFEETSNIVGVEKVIGESVPSHPTLIAKNQTASSDLMLDTDGKVRRGLLSVITPANEVRETLGTVLAMNYLLLGKGISVEAVNEDSSKLALGKGTVQQFDVSDGAYVNADAGGFQVLLNYRGNYEKFESVSMSDVLDGKLTRQMVQGKLVFVGATAASLNDWFATPVGGDQVPGVYIHAHLASQLMDVALEGESFLRTIPDFLEWVWVCFWIASSAVVSRSVLYSSSLKSEVSIWQMILRISLLSVGLVSICFALFIFGWWLPVVLPLAAMSTATTLGMGYRNQQLQNIAAFDELTQVSNRRYFDQKLADEIRTAQRLSLILCDVDYFKAYNDRYGHPAGDRCLQQVAQALQLGVRESDLVARYGGEEFAVVLPDTDEALAANIADRIQIHMRQMEVVHEGSQISEYVTISCGIATVRKGQSLTPLQLIEYADQALYEAKQAGRNRSMVSQWQKLASAPSPEVCSDNEDARSVRDNKVA